MSYKGLVDPPEACGVFCTHHGPGSCDPCAFVYYPLAPGIAAEKKAAFVGVCAECGATSYTSVLPANAAMAGEAHA